MQTKHFLQPTDSDDKSDEPDAISKKRIIVFEERKSEARSRRVNVRSRTTIDDITLEILKEAFEKNNYISLEQRQELVERTGLTHRTVKHWFLNRRFLLKRGRAVK